MKDCKRVKSSHTASGLIIFLMTITIVMAQQSERNTRDELIVDNVIYAYTSTYTAQNASEEDKYDNWITAKTITGEHLFIQKVDRNAGCDGNTPAIQRIAILTDQSELIERRQQKEDFIAFCGSYLGHDNVMWLYKPNYGFVYTIKFGNFIPRFTENRDSTDVIIYTEKWLSTLGFKVNIPTIYELRSRAALIVSTPTTDAQKYKQLLTHEYYSSPTKIVKTEKIIIQALAGELSESCLQIEALKNQDVLKELTDKTSINFQQCEEI